MPKKIKIIKDEDGSDVGSEDQKQDLYNEADISDEEDRRRHRKRNRNKYQYSSGPKIIDDTWLPSSMNKLRACIYCKLVLNQEKWSKLKQCPNCPESSASLDETTDNYESLISLVLPLKSWVAQWQQMRNCIPGIYAMAVRAPN